MPTNIQRKLLDSSVVQGVVLLDSDGGVQTLAYDNDLPSMNMNGLCKDVDDVLRDMWDGPTALYVFPTVAQQMRVVSTSANDASAGTGVQKIEIHYLDADYNAKSEIVTMNGVTPVLTVATNIIRINDVHAVAHGSLTVSGGAISITNTAGTVTYSYWGVGQNSARQAIYTVPAGYNLEVINYSTSSGSTGLHFTRTLFVANNDLTASHPGIFVVKHEFGTQNGSISASPLPPHFIAPEKTDIKLTVISDNNAANVIAVGSVSGILHPIV